MLRRLFSALQRFRQGEILFPLGIIYKQQGKFEDSLACFDRILQVLSHVFEHTAVRKSLMNVSSIPIPNMPRFSSNLVGFTIETGPASKTMTTLFNIKALEADPSDAQSWYLLGCPYMAGQKYNETYEGYIYRDGHNPILHWRTLFSNQSTRTLSNPYISEVWFDLGSLYETCFNQITDAIDAYARAAELDPSHVAIAQRLQPLKDAQATGSQLPAAPSPQDVHPTASASSVVPPPANLNGSTPHASAE